MNALLIYPEFPDTFWSFRHALKFIGKKSAFPPLGLLTISSMLPKAWNRRLVDMNVRPLTTADLKWADVVFASAMYVQKESLKEVISLCKAEGKKIVMGGPYASMGLNDAIQADHVFVGEVETTFPGFLDDLAHGGAKAVYQASERPALSLTPIPDFALAELEQYSDMSVQYSRGCPFNCEFCDIIEIYGRVPRTKSNQQILAELDALVRVGWRGEVFIVDDNFIGNKKNVRTLIPELAEWSARNHYPFAFTTEASVNLADDDELLEQMRTAGFRQVFIGIETPVTESLKEAQKGQNTRRDLIDSVRHVQSYGMEVLGGFIVGFDNDPDDIYERQINFIRESAIPVAMVGLLAAIPDTQLWRRLEREGRLMGVEEHSGSNTDCVLNFVPKMDADRLIEGYKSIIRNIYSPGEYYQRSLDSLGRVAREGAPRIGGGGLKKEDIFAFARIVFALGVRDRSRGEFWSFMRQVVSQHRDKIDDGLMFAALGYHFRKLTEAYLCS
ncbi:MAG: B12-binding domain-containing radical SAM protein [Acidobacteria bacterium]|nr:MAG: B12-binding domain-containing radical SAM protein [Acidobacteriota bacterium]